MRMLTGVVVLALGFSIGCAGRTSTTAGGGGGGAATQARMTEADYDAIMKKVGPTNGGMRKAIMSNQLADAGKNAQQLAMLFGDVERFEQYKVMDAAKIAAEARRNATETAGAAAGGAPDENADGCRRALGSVSSATGCIALEVRRAGS